MNEIKEVIQNYTCKIKNSQIQWGMKVHTLKTSGSKEVRMISKKNIWSLVKNWKHRSSGLLK